MVYKWSEEADRWSVSGLGTATHTVQKILDTSKVPVNELVSGKGSGASLRGVSVTGCKSTGYADFRSIDGRTLDAKVRHVESASLILRSRGNKRC